MMTVFFFARYWRRAGILTDVEFVELRYEEKKASRVFARIPGDLSWRLDELPDFGLGHQSDDQHHHGFAGSYDRAGPGVGYRRLAATRCLLHVRELRIRDC